MGEATVGSSSAANGANGGAGGNAASLSSTTPASSPRWRLKAATASVAAFDDAGGAAAATAENPAAVAVGAALERDLGDVAASLQLLGNLALFDGAVNQPALNRAAAVAHPLLAMLMGGIVSGGRVGGGSSAGGGGVGREGLYAGTRQKPVCVCWEFCMCFLPTRPPSLPRHWNSGRYGQVPKHPDPGNRNYNQLLYIIVYSLYIFLLTTHFNPQNGTGDCPKAGAPLSPQWPCPDRVA